MITLSYIRKLLSNVKKHCAGIPKDPYTWIDNFVYAATVSSLGDDLRGNPAISQCRKRKPSTLNCYLHIFCYIKNVSIINSPIIIKPMVTFLNKTIHLQKAQLPVPFLSF